MTTLAALLALTPTAPITPIVVNGTQCHPQNLMVKVKNEAALDRIRKTGARVVRTIPQIGWAVVQCPRGRLQATKKKLETTVGVVEVSLDKTARPCYVPNDPLFGSQWHLPKIKVDQAWNTSLGTAGPVVAVIDGGVLATHPDLAANMWVNPGEIPGNNIDDDSNGYIDDVNGYDFGDLDGNPTDEPGSGWYGHGTACAGIIAARGDNSIGVTGVAPRARIMSIKITGAGMGTFDSVIVPAYTYAADMGARVFSISYTFHEPSSAQQDALKYATQKGVLAVAAAGRGTVIPVYPAAYDNVIAVSATDATDNILQDHVSWGSWVDVVAPGVNLVTTTVDGGYGPTNFGEASGAVPQVAGLAALLKGVKNVSRNRLIQLIEDTAIPLTSPGYGEFSNYGMIDANAAMAHLVANTNPAPHTAKVSFIAPFGYAKAGITAGKRATIYGRNLTGAVVKVGGTPATMVSTGRDAATFLMRENTGPVTVEDSLGNIVGTYNPPLTYRHVWPLSEANGVDSGENKSPSTGGFAEALVKDGQYVTCGWNASDKGCVLFAYFKNMPTSGPMKLILNRSYLKGKDGFEQVRMWPTNGGVDFVSATDLPLTSAQQDLVINIPDIAPYVNHEGIVVVSIHTYALKTTVLQLDAMYFSQ